MTTKEILQAMERGYEVMAANAAPFGNTNAAGEHKSFSGFHGISKKVHLLGEYKGMTGMVHGQVQKRYSAEKDMFHVQVDGFPKAGGWNGKITIPAEQMRDHE